MTGHVLAVALNTFRETVRDRVLYLVGVFGLVLIGSSAVLSPLAIGAQSKVVADVGLASLTLFGLLVVVFVGSGMVHKEIDKRTVTVLLAKPLSRRAYVVGKFAGLSLTVACLLGVMAVVFVVVALAARVPLHAGYAIALLMALLELLVVTAAVIFLSTFVSPVLSAVFTVALFVIGHLSADLRAFGEVMGGPALQLATRLLYFALPDLEVFNVRGAVVYGDPIAAGQVLRAGVYGLGLTALLLVLAGAVFSRKELR